MTVFPQDLSIRPIAMIPPQRTQRRWQLFLDESGYRDCNGNSGPPSIGAPHPVARLQRLVARRGEPIARLGVARGLECNAARLTVQRAVFVRVWSELFQGRVAEPRPAAVVGGGNAKATAET